MISICVPTIRVANIPKLQEAVKQAVSCSYEFLWKEDKERIGCAKTLQSLIEQSKYDKVCFLGDDSLPEPGAIDKALKHMEETGAWLAGFDDEGRGRKATHFILDKQLLQFLDGRCMFYPGYIHGADEELVWRAQKLGKYVFCEDATVVHNHPFFGKGKMDDDYKRVSVQEVFDKDHLLFQKRCLSTRPLVAFVGIFKDEKETIAATIRSVKPYVDYWCILDTGSTDGTQEIIKKEFEGVPGELHEEAFVNYAVSRNRVLELLGTKTIFAFMLSAEEELKNGKAFRDFLEKHTADATGAYLISVNFGEINYDSPRVSRTEKGWRYQEPTHEVLCSPINERPGKGSIEEFGYIYRDRSRWDPRKDRRKWIKDCYLLSLALEENPENTRSVFYLGQSYDVLGDFEKALSLYKKRTSMGGFDEEVFIAQVRIGNQLKNLGKWPEAMEAYLKAHQMDPSRAEPLYEIAKYYREKGENAIAYIFDKRCADIPYPTERILFVDRTLYEHKALEGLSISAYYVGKMAEGKKACEDLIAKLPDGHAAKKTALNNIKFYL